MPGITLLQKQDIAFPLSELHGTLPTLFPSLSRSLWMAAHPSGVSATLRVHSVLAPVSGPTIGLSIDT